MRLFLKNGLLRHPCPLRSGSMVAVATLASPPAPSIISPLGAGEEAVSPEFGFKFAGAAIGFESNPVADNHRKAVGHDVCALNGAPVIPLPQRCSKMDPTATHRVSAVVSESNFADGHRWVRPGSEIICWRNGVISPLLVTLTGDDSLLRHQAGRSPGLKAPQSGLAFRIFLCEALGSPAPPGRCHRRAVFAVWRKHPVESGEVDPRPRHQGCQHLMQVVLTVGIRDSGAGEGRLIRGKWTALDSEMPEAGKRHPRSDDIRFNLRSGSLASRHLVLSTRNESEVV